MESLVEYLRPLLHDDALEKRHCPERQACPGLLGVVLTLSVLRRHGRLSVSAPELRAELQRVVQRIDPEFFVGATAHLDGDVRALCRAGLVEKFVTPDDDYLRLHRRFEDDLRTLTLEVEDMALDRHSVKPPVEHPVLPQITSSHTAAATMNLTQSMYLPALHDDYTPENPAAAPSAGIEQSPPQSPRVKPKTPPGWCIIA